MQKKGPEIAAKGGQGVNQAYPFILKSFIVVRPLIAGSFLDAL